MDRFSYLLVRIFLLVFRFIPFSVLWLFSDVTRFVLYRLTGYRRKVVSDNLALVFPGKDGSERLRIMKAFYRHLADMLVESIKSFSVTEEAIIRRYRFLNADLLDRFYAEGRSVICVAGHYGNWEWGGIASGGQLKHRPVGFYKPLSNRHVDAFVRKTRVKGRAVIASITDTAVTFNTDWGEPAIYYMVADQSPSSARLAYWVPFLGQETATLHGPEKYARLHNLPVLFASARKVKRGYYTVRFEVITEDPSQLKTGEITRRFMHSLEKVVLGEPAYYLWSHRRWKLKKPPPKS